MTEDEEIIYVDPSGTQPLVVGGRGRAALTVVIAGPGGPSGPPGLSGEDGDEPWTPPGGGTAAAGAPGAAGPAGAAGQPGSDGDDGADGLTIPGPPGPAGASGAAGAAGAPGIAGEDGDEPWTPVGGLINFPTQSILNAGGAGFWSDVDGSASIWRFTRRMFVAQATLQDGTRVGSCGYIPNAAAGANWAVRDSQFAVMDDRGSMAVTGITRASDGDDQTAHPASIGVSGFVIADSANGKSGWGGYFDVQYVSGATGYGIEIAVKNTTATNLAATADNAVTGTVGIWLDTGDDSYGPVHNAPNNSAIQIGRGASGNTWNRGLVVFNNALTPDAFGRGRAISLGKLHHISWYDGNNNEAFYITSGVVTSGKGSSILALDSAFYFQNQSGVALAQMLTDHSTNGGPAVNVFGNLNVTGAMSGQLGAPAWGGDDGDDGWIIPGVAGAPGPPGPAGPTGLPPYVTTVMSLPTPFSAGYGAIAFVKDSLLPISTGSGTPVQAGGTNFVPVYSDATTNCWLIWAGGQQGPAGAAGATGVQGPQGAGVPGATGDDGDDGWTIPGATGAAGAAATTKDSTTASFRANPSTTQTVSTLATVVFGTKAFDVGTHFASNAWVPPAGTVLLSASVAATIATGATSASVSMQIVKNAATTIAAVTSPDGAGTSFSTGAALSAVDQCNGTDSYTITLSSTQSIVIQTTSCFSGTMV